MALREEQRQLTRRKVLDAVLDLVAEGTLDKMSVPAVARRSGVSVATIYRHFASKDDLLSAAASAPVRRVAARQSASVTSEWLDDFLPAMWQEFSQNLSLLRHQMSSQTGRYMRRARVDDARTQVTRYVEQFDIDPSSPDGDRLVSLILLLSGSAALVELHDRQEIPVDQASNISLWAIHALIDQTRD